MLSLLGLSMIGGSIVGISYPAFESIFLKHRYNRKKLIENLYKSFENAALNNKFEVYPSLLKLQIKPNKITFVFSVPKGMNPEDINKKSYVFKQHFGEHISLDVNESRVVLEVYKKGLPPKHKFDWKEIKVAIEGMNLPVVAGINKVGEMIAYDMIKENRANLIIIGEPGAGKSTQIRQILTTWVKYHKPDQLKMYLADLKRSEFYLFRNLENTNVLTTEEELLPKLHEIRKEMNKRGQLLDKHEVSHIDDLPIKLPYIALCIDEFSIVAQNKDILKLMQQITSLGRALGIVCLISMQRASHDLIPTFIRSNMNVGMGFRVVDKSNANMIGTEGAEQIKQAGRMICKIDKLEEIQAPLLEIDKAKRLLKPFKVRDKIVHREIGTTQIDEYSKVRELFSNE